jgi:hypothetical protein
MRRRRHRRCAPWPPKRARRSPVALPADLAQIPVVLHYCEPDAFFASIASRTLWGIWTPESDRPRSLSCPRSERISSARWRANFRRPWVDSFALQSSQPFRKRFARNSIVDLDLHGDLNAVGKNRRWRRVRSVRIRRPRISHGPKLSVVPACLTGRFDNVRPRSHGRRLSGTVAARTDEQIPPRIVSAGQSVPHHRPHGP